MSYVAAAGCRTIFVDYNYRETQGKVAANYKVQNLEEVKRIIGKDNGT